MKGYRQPTWSSGRRGFWLSSGCLPELVDGIQCCWGRPGKDGIWESQKVWMGAREAASGVSLQRYV